MMIEMSLTWRPRWGPYDGMVQQDQLQNDIYMHEHDRKNERITPFSFKRSLITTWQVTSNAITDATDLVSYLKVNNLNLFWYSAPVDFIISTKPDTKLVVPAILN